MADSPAPFRTLRGIQHFFPLSMISEQIVQVEPKGVVYTKEWVVELLLDLAGYISEANLVDIVAVEPAAGEGAFLKSMIERLIDSCRRQNRSISVCRDSLIAYELDEARADRAKAQGIKALMNKGVGSELAEDLLHGWIRTGDYLLNAMDVRADFVIGNPPYVRLEDMPERMVSLYRDVYPTMRGRADLYVAFFEAALHQLKEGGVCAFICADRWMRNQYGAALRDLITSDFAVNAIVEMHNASAFHDEVDAYPAISVIRRQTQGPAIVAKANVEAEDMTPHALSLALLNDSRTTGEAVSRGLEIARVDTWFKGSDPWPCQSPEQLKLLRRLEDRFPSLEASAKVGIGVATGNDKIFITKDSQVVEPSRLLKLAMASDITSGIMKWSGHYLIDPWDREGLVKLEEYPRLREYFETHRIALEARHTAKRSLNRWYKTIDRVNHAIAAKRKLCIADIKDRLDPVLDDGETYPHHNLYFIQSDDWDLEVLGGLLISAIGQFFVECYGVRMRGGYLRFQAQYLRRIRVPNPRTLSKRDTEQLLSAFRARNRRLATDAAQRIYGIEDREMETTIGHR